MRTINNFDMIVDHNRLDPESIRTFATKCAAEMNGVMAYIYITDHCVQNLGVRFQVEVFHSFVRDGTDARQSHDIVAVGMYAKLSDALAAFRRVPQDHYEIGDMETLSTEEELDKLVQCLRPV